jgi:hypothetical protein
MIVQKGSELISLYIEDGYKWVGISYPFAAREIAFFHPAENHFSSSLLHSFHFIKLSSEGECNIMLSILKI